MHENVEKIGIFALIIVSRKKNHCEIQILPQKFGVRGVPEDLGIITVFCQMVIRYGTPGRLYK